MDEHRDPPHMGPFAEPVPGRRARRSQRPRPAVDRRLTAITVTSLLILTAVAFGLLSMTGCRTAGDDTEAAMDATTITEVAGSEAGVTGELTAASTTLTARESGAATSEVTTPSTSRTLTTSTSSPAGVAGGIPPTSALPQPLRVETDPPGAALTITLQDGSRVTGTTPFSREVPGGSLTISASLAGYNTVARKIALADAQRVNMWLDPEGQLLESVTRFPCGKQPKQVLFTPDGSELWVTILGGGKTGLEAYDPRTGEQLAAIRLGGREGTELTMTRDGSTIFVSQMATDTIWVIDRAERTVLRHFRCGGRYPKILLLSRDEKYLYSSNWNSDDVSEIDWTTGEVKRVIPVVDTPRGLYITPDDRYMYVSGFGVGELQKIDLATGRGMVLYKTGGSFRHMAADEQKGLLYVGEFADGEVYVCDLATDKVRRLCLTDQRPNTIDLSPDGRVLYVSNRGKDNPKTGYLTKGPEWGSVLAIDAGTGRLLDAIVGGNQCTGLDVSPDGTLLAFSDFLDHAIRVYRIPDYAALAAGEGGRAPTHLQDIVKR